MRPSKRALILAAGGSVLAWTTGAAAQTAEASKTTDVSEVVITGSRIARDGYSAPTPVTVASIEVLQAVTPSNIPDALNKLPSWRGAVLRGSSGAQSPTAGNYLNLRAAR